MSPDLEDEPCEQEAAEWAYECAMLESLALSDADLAEVDNEALLESLEPESAPEPVDSLPIVALPPKPVPWRPWPAAERAQLACALREVGTTITEVSDARELVGLPRCSTAPPVRIEWAVRWAASEEGVRLLRSVREQRAVIEAELSHPDVAGNAATARQLLGVKGARPSTWRLGELRAIWAQTRLIAAYLERVAA